MNTNPVNLNAPTNLTDQEAVDDFYAVLEEIMSKIPSREMTVVFGDINAKVGETCHKT